jgi:hypothetical protein
VLRQTALEEENAELLRQRRERAKGEIESATFWSRRFFVTLALANAGAFVTMASGLVQAEDPSKIAALVTPALVHFSWGMLASGAIPLFLWIQYQVRDFRGGYYKRNLIQERVLPFLEGAARQAVYTATVFGVTYFVLGVFTALGSAQGIIP